MKELVEDFRGIREENLGLLEQAKRMDEELERRAALERSALPALVGNRLQGARIALIYTDETKRVKFECALSTVLMIGGATIVSETVVGRDFEASVARVKPAEAQKLGIGPEVSPALVAAQIAERVIAGKEEALRALNSLGSVQASVSLGSAPDAVVVFAAPREEDEGRCQALDSPLLEALVAGGAFVVVGLGRDVPAARAASYRQKGVTIIEAANTIPGEVELVEVLQGHLKGSSKAAGVLELVVPGG